MKNKTLACILVCCFAWIQAIQAAIPQRPNPPRLVNDLAQIFTPQQQTTLEHILVAFNDSTSNQIVILTLADLEGQDKAQVAYEVGENWGVGQKGVNNGIVILIKPKNETQGEAAIQVGYGLESVLPDATCYQIIQNEMIPFFRENNYYQGVLHALNVIFPIVSGEYSYKQYGQHDVSMWKLLLLLGGLFFIVFLVVLLTKGKNNGGNGGITGKPLTMFWLGGMAGGSSGGFGGSSGSGGFGGFGGGSFGGGGAGGSW